MITDADFFQKRETTINKFPELGRKRAEHYFKDILPKGIDNGWFDGGPIEWIRKGAWQKMNPSERKPFIRKLEETNLMGMNTISAISTRRFKKGFVESGDLSAHAEGGQTRVFFDRPSDEELVDMSFFYGNQKNANEEDSFDIGVPEKVNKNNFRAVQISHGIYDEVERKLSLTGQYFDKEKRVSAEDLMGHEPSPEAIEELAILQKTKKVFVFSDDFQPLPPLESISIERTSYDKFLRRGGVSGARLREVQEKNKQETQETIKQLITENHWDWYEKYGKESDE